jgi:translocation and assembly module TamA
VAFAAVWIACIATDADATIEIHGLDDAQERNVRAHLSLSDVGCDAPVWLVRRQYRIAEMEVREGLEALGYYDPNIDASLDVPTGDCWVARFAIEAGRPVEVARVDVSVGELTTLKVMQARLRARKELEGKQLNHGTYEAYKQSIANVARMVGYFDSRFTTAKVSVDAEARTATISLALEPGERYRFGRISVSSEALRPELVRAYVPFKEGAPYDGIAVSQLRRDLNDSGYFGQVTVQAEPSHSEARDVPVSIEVTAPNPRRVYTVGVGYATDTGVRFRADVTDRLRNDRGHRAGASLLVSPVRSTINANYRLPHRNPIDDWFSFDIGYTHEDTDTSKTDAQRAGIRHIHQRGDWVETNFIEGSLEDFEIAGERSESRLLMIGTSWTRTKTEENPRPMQGYRLTAELRGALRYLGSDNDFAQARLSGKHVLGLGSKLRVLTRAEVGWTVKDDFSSLPPSVRYFAGGDNSIRGYGYQELGPEEDGEVVGGSRLVLGSLELDYPFFQRWSVAAFVDTGSAYDDKPQMSTGAGLGVRWYSPLGPIRVDVAHPFDSDDDVRLHITVGPDL